jgi:hypothetical protein
MKEVEGLFFPHRTVLLTGPQEVAFDATLIELNPAIDPKFLSKSYPRFLFLNCFFSVIRYTPRRMSPHPDH